MNKLLKISAISIFILLIFLSGTFLSGMNNLKTGLKIQAEKITRTEIQGIAEFFGGDLFEGRAPGTRGGYLAEHYIKSMLKFMNIAPFNGRYIHPFKLIGFTTKKLTMSSNGVKLKNREDIVGSYIGKTDKFTFTAKAVFAGFGTETGLWKWDDFKGTDISGKFVIVRVNDPGMFRKKIFEGKILTYFGRWTYHIEELKKRGAAGVLLIHTDASAGYGWKVVRNSWGGEELYLESDLKDKLKFSGWIKEKSMRLILRKKGIDLDKLYKKSLSKKFRPVDLGFSISISGERTSRVVNNSNVVGLIKGRSGKKIVLSAHIDHFGIRDGEPGKDKIFNGAIDNGTAVTSMLLSAKILKKFQKDLYYSVLILATNAEESGLLGSRYFVQNYRGNDIIANINFESTPVWKRSDSVMGVGARFSSIEDNLKSLAKEEGLKYSYFSMSNQGFFFRSDQFPFAKAGIPAIWISAGEEEISGERNYKKFWEERYHTVKDEFNPDWDLGGLKQTVKFALMLTGYFNDTKTEPSWKSNLTFPINKNR